MRRVRFTWKSFGLGGVVPSLGDKWVALRQVGRRDGGYSSFRFEDKSGPLLSRLDRRGGSHGRLKGAGWPSFQESHPPKTGRSVGFRRQKTIVLSFLSACEACLGVPLGAKYSYKKVGHPKGDRWVRRRDQCRWMEPVPEHQMARRKHTLRQHSSSERRTAG